MKNYKSYSTDKLITVYNTLKKDYKEEQKDYCNTVTKVYKHFIQGIKKELNKRNTKNYFKK
tara:strand:- start:11 stop:193 length:183 start_codon:yes stop_codon:yes gene_type:complete